ncbi:MAG: hypothetical protein ACK2T2_10645 [Anaerolineales bacterium]|jgi:hypothetical protein
MNETITNPIIIALMFIARCLVPLGIMLLISYYLRKWGLIVENDDHNDQNDEAQPKEIS